jgi:hypothetical protein
MEAKEKAKELFLKFRQIPPFSPYTGIDDGEAKQCALIAVDEILDYIQEEDNWYWQDVKHEIEKL